MKSKIRYMLFFLAVLLIVGIGTYNSLIENKAGTYVIITVDTERDVPPLLNTYRGIDEGVPILLDLFDQYDVNATFLVTGNVALMRPETIKTISQHHEVGNHSLYHVQPLYTLSFESKCLRIEESTRILEDLTGKEITSFRAPGHSCDTELLKVLQNNGYLVEASAYKGDSYPYHPSEEDWESEGDMDILRVPVSNAPDYFYSFFYFEESWIDAYEYVLLQQAEKDIKVVVIGIHPWELCDLELDEANAATERICGEETLGKLTELLEYLKDKDIEYITLSQSYELFN